jgi:coproporphyrinogen III oxidase-like Fe-S oxidoreductase
MMGLRLNSGIIYDDWKARTGLALRGAFSEKTVRELCEREFIVADERHIRATGQGVLLLNAITRELLVLK